jgi:hypothetical protein
VPKLTLINVAPSSVKDQLLPDCAMGTLIRLVFKPVAELLVKSKKPVPSSSTLVN